MNDPQSARLLLLAYLLDELPPGERHATEERMLAEQDFSDQMQEAEYDLIDDYHAGRLTALEQRRTRAAFQQKNSFRYLPLAFQGSLSRPAAPLESPSEPSRRLLRFSAAALLLVAAIGGMLLFRGLRPATTLLSRSKGAALGSSGTSTPSVVADSKNIPGSDTTAVLLLPSDVTRGEQALSLELQPGVRTVLIQWVAPIAIANHNFRLSLSDNGKVVGEVLQDKGLKNIGGTPVVEFHLDPLIFDGITGRARLLLLIRDESALRAPKAEFQVSISRRRK